MPIRLSSRPGIRFPINDCSSAGRGRQNNLTREPVLRLSRRRVLICSAPFLTCHPLDEIGTDPGYALSGRPTARATGSTSDRADRPMHQHMCAPGAGLYRVRSTGSDDGPYLHNGSGSHLRAVLSPGDRRAMRRLSCTVLRRTRRWGVGNAALEAGHRAETILRNAALSRGITTSAGDYANTSHSSAGF